ncbi:MAG TPA: HD domain-containing protein [Pirellulaceae bacterium]|nr:HD domain-containing protein [Pirellulaceae bacterium]HMO91051.1 HD domain-containing protein [Pirellulaceae bacterium]HMP68166.1 HD domain-containing protein [Pirellulaceae bacterium]
MELSKLRRQIAWQAARLLYSREETEYYRAKMKAARSVQIGWVKPADLPSNLEIREQIRILAQMYEGEKSHLLLRDMRLEALRLMRLLTRFNPRLLGSVLTGHIRHGSDIDLHLFSDSLDAIRGELEYHGVFSQVTRKRVVKQGRSQVYQHLHIRDRFKFELTVYARNMLNHVFISSITGKPVERANINQLEQLLRLEYPGIDLDLELKDRESKIDRFQLYFALLLPLDSIQQDVRYHPEGDVLYHSLQVFDRAMDRLPYDEEFLLAALLHDVGKGIDPENHVAAGVEAICDYVTPRTLWLVENHMQAHKYRDGRLGHRAKTRLRENESFDELMILAECDRQGRVCGIETTSLEDAIEYLRDISDQFAY